MSTQKFSIIACVNNEMALGNNNQLLYHIKSDLRNFKDVTTDNVVIMGRKTFESLPRHNPLPKRINIILTHDKDFIKQIDTTLTINTHVAASIDEVIEICQKHYQDKEWFVIGGATLYNAFIEQDLIHKAYITEVNDNMSGDAYLSSFHKEEWNIESQKNDLQEEEYHFTYTVYTKKS